MEKITELHLDLETFSDVDISKCGVYKYVESEQFDILLFGVSINGGPVVVYDLASGETIPNEILDALTNNEILKWAFNVNFERVCISAWLRKHYPERFVGYGLPDDSTCQYLDPVSWRCTMVWSAYLGLPLSLAGVGSVLNLQDQKLTEGKDLIRYFCMPCKPTKTNGGRTRNLPEHSPEKWALFKKYCNRDVEVDLEIYSRLKRYPVPQQVWEEFLIDQEINDRGIALDMLVVENAILLDDQSTKELTATMRNITNLDNPNSVTQLRQWLMDNGIRTETLNKNAVTELIRSTSDPKIREALLLRQQLAKTSVKKYLAMQNAVCKDFRVHGMFQFYGANRTGRWSGRLAQLQNLHVNSLPDLTEARSLVQSGDYETVKLLYDSVPMVLSELIRTAFIPRQGYKFIVADFSAIEARVLAFLSGEAWRVKAFANGKDIYCESASHMFGVPVEKNGINSHLRKRGKLADLSLGYGASSAVLIKMGALEMGLSETELRPLVESWRSSNSAIVAFWWDTHRAVIRTLKTGIASEVRGIRFIYQSGMLFIRLPSGRTLSYVKPQIGENQYGGECFTYEGIDEKKHYSRISSYGPKIVENIVQGVSRDILAFSMRTLHNHRIVGHVHDELIIECPEETSVDFICKQMSKSPTWMPGIRLNAEGYETYYYKK